VVWDLELELHLLILPFKVFVVAPMVIVSSFCYIYLLAYDLPISKFLHKMAFWFWRLFFGIVLKVDDLRSDQKKRPKIIVLNHASYMDGFIVGSIVYKYRTISASWAFDTPIYGQWLKASHSVPLYRDKKKGNTTSQIYNDTSDFIITLASEGTMTNGKGLIEFRTGAFIGKTEVLPIVIKYLNTEFNNSWIKGSSPMWKHLIMLISQLRNPVEVCIMEPYIPTEKEKNDPSLFSQNVRRYMSEQSGLPMIDVSYKESPALQEFI
jgi:1-acyl-sn-glycerol-3-phosphate acyltransferase